VKAEPVHLVSEPDDSEPGADELGVQPEQHQKEPWQRFVATFARLGLRGQQGLVM
jgi:hypothetical protein